MSEQTRQARLQDLREIERAAGRVGTEHLSSPRRIWFTHAAPV